MRRGELGFRDETITTRGRWVAMTVVLIQPEHRVNELCVISRFVSRLGAHDKLEYRPPIRKKIFGRWKEGYLSTRLGRRRSIYHVADAVSWKSNKAVGRKTFGRAMTPVLVLLWRQRAHDRRVSKRKVLGTQKEILCDPCPD